MDLRRWRWIGLLLAIVLVAAACSDDDGGDGDATTTTAADEETTADEEGAGGVKFDEALSDEVLVSADDPWPPGGFEVEAAAAHELDEIWPADVFPDERAAYEEAGFQDGILTFFDDTADGEFAGGFSAAHRFPDAESAAAALALVETWHRDPVNVAPTFGLDPEMLPMVEEISGVDLGDEAVAFKHTDGEFFTVVVVVWRTDNVVHILRAGTVPDDVERETGVVDLAVAIDERIC